MNPTTKLLLALLLLLSILPACKQGAEGFFSGRPSDMSMAHNRTIAGGETEMLVLLRVPARFPDATEEHIVNWQNSVIAWWQVPEKRPMMEVALGGLDRAETDALIAWLRVRYKNRSPKFDPVLAEVEQAASRQRAD